MAESIESLSELNDDELVGLLRGKLPDGFSFADFLAVNPETIQESLTTAARLDRPDSTAEIQLLLQQLDPPQAADELANIPGYRILSVLGKGGMGVVVEADDTLLSRRVAIKFIRPNRLTDGAATDRFLIEARSAARLTHDNIVTVYHVGKHRQIPFLVMQLLQGEPLSMRLRREGRITALEALQIVRQIAAGLEAAHHVGLLHRDIKPDNIWLERDLPRVKLLDFGLAQLTEDDGQLVGAPVIGGTPKYIAPECIQGSLGDRRSDIFGLGVVLYELLSGVQPFQATRVSTQLRLAVEESPVALPPLEKAFDAPVRSIVERMIAKDPSVRPQTAKSVVDEIDAILSRTASGSPKNRRIPFVFVAIAVLLAVGGTTAATMIAQKQRTAALQIREQMYPIRLNEAKAAWEAGNVSRMAEILDEWVPSPNEPDLRGWEWFYFDRFRPSTDDVVYVKDKGFSGIAIAGNLVALSGRAESNIQILEAPSGRVQAKLELSDGCCQFLALSGDGKRVACSLDTGRIQVWEVETAKKLFDVAQVTCCLALNSKGTKLACAGDEQFFVYDVADSNLEHHSSHKYLKNDTGRLAFSPDDLRCAVGIRFAAFLFVYDTQNWREICQFIPYNRESNHRYFGIAWHPDSNRIAVASAAKWDTTGNIQIWNCNEAKVETSFRAMPNHVFNEAYTSLAYNPQGDLLAIAEYEGGIRICDWATGDTKCEIPIGAGEFASMGFLKDGQRLVGGSLSGKVRVASWLDRQPYLTVEGVGRSDWSFDSRFLVSKSHVASVEDKILIIDGQTGVTVNSISVPPNNYIPGIACSPIDERVAYSVQTGPTGEDSDGYIFISDYRSKEFLLQLPARYYQSIAWSPDGSRLVGSQIFEGSRVTVWDTASGNVVWQNTSAHRGDVVCVTWSPDGAMIASKDKGGTVFIWAPGTGEILSEIKPEKAGFQAVGGQWTLAFSPDSKTLAIAFGETLRLWDVKANVCTRTIKAHAKSTEAVSWTPDGKCLATGGNDSLVNVWNPATGQLLLSFRDQSSVALVAFSRDGANLATHNAPIGKIKIYRSTEPSGGVPVTR